MPQDSQGRYYEGAEARTDLALASAARTTSTNSSAVTVDNLDAINGTLVITAATGTNPTLDVALQTTVDGTNWYDVGAFAQQVTTQAGLGEAFAPLGSQVRWKWTIGGTDTPTFTFAITATANRDN